MTWDDQSIVNALIEGEPGSWAYFVERYSGVVVGSDNTFNMAALMGPLAQVGNYCSINTHVMLASESVLGDHCYVGMGAKVLQGLEVAEGTVIGASAFVNRKYPPWSTIVGVPVRLVRTGRRPADISRGCSSQPAAISGSEPGGFPTPVSPILVAIRGAERSA